MLAEARRKTPKETKFDFQPHSGRANFQKHRADSPHSSSRYPDRDRQKPDRYAASAVKKAVGEAKMKTRRRIRSRVKDFYKAMDKGARRVTPKDLLASDFPDSSDTDGFRSTTESSSSDGDDDGGGGD